MFFFVYLMTLGLSAGAVSLFVHDVLQSQGYAPNFDIGLQLTACVAACYIASQLFYAAVIFLLKPPKGQMFFFAECLSHVPAAILALQFLHLDINWPHPLLERVEPLLFLGAFVALHIFLKFFSFFAALQSAKGNRAWGLAWSLAAAGVAAVAAQIFQVWTTEFGQAQSYAEISPAPYESGGQHCTAQPLAEADVAQWELRPQPGHCISFQLANQPGGMEIERLEGVYVTVEMEGGESEDYRTYARLADSGWSTVRINAAEIPPGTQVCRLWWSVEEQPAWRRLLNLRPLSNLQREILVAGPRLHMAREDSDLPNLVVLMIEGLGASHMSLNGYERETTPELDKLAFRGVNWPQAFTPAPEAAAACMSALTGLSPLRHGYLEGHAGPLPEEFKTLAEVCARGRYTTAAFTEGTAANDLVYGSGFERGFDLFDDAYAWDQERSEEEESPTLDDEDGESTLPAGSRLTLDRAWQWIEGNQDVQFAVFIRIRELLDLQHRDRYGNPFGEKGDDEPTRKAYDAALAYIDRQVGAFVDRVQTEEVRKHTFLIVASPYGLSFQGQDGNAAQVGLTEESLHVPLIAWTQGLDTLDPALPVSLQDVAPTMLAQAGMQLPGIVEGIDVLRDSHENAPVSMFGTPLVLSKRDDKFRLYWDTGRSAFGEELATASGQPQLYDVRRSLRRGWNLDEASRYTNVVGEWMQELRLILQQHDRIWVKDSEGIRPGNDPNG